jgi:hypothetical protein
LLTILFFRKIDGMFAAKFIFVKSVPVFMVRPGLFGYSLGSSWAGHETPPTSSGGSAAAIRASLAKVLTFHASFDDGPDADFAVRDWRIHHATFQLHREEQEEPEPGLGSPPLNITQGRGKFGSALEFMRKNSHVVVYKAEKNVAYSPGSFRGTSSF